MGRFSLLLSLESRAGPGFYGSWVFPPGSGDDMSIACEESEVCLGTWTGMLWPHKTAGMLLLLFMIWNSSTLSPAVHMQRKPSYLNLLKHVRMSNVLSKMKGPSSINEGGKSIILLYILFAAPAPPHN